MDKKLFDSLDDSLKEKLKSCKDEAEMQRMIADAGLELSDEMLQGVSGGYTGDCPFYCWNKEVGTTGGDTGDREHGGNGRR